MNTNDPVSVGVFTFCIWAIAGAGCFVAAEMLPRLLFSAPQKIYDTRLIILCLVLAVWWLTYSFRAGYAYVGNYADLKDADRRARYIAKQSGHLYGAHTIWPWIVVGMRIPKQKSYEARNTNQRASLDAA